VFITSVQKLVTGYHRWVVAELETTRLQLRAWRDSDLAPFANLNGDPQVMEHFPGVLDHRASDQMAERIRARMAEQGWGLWATERKDTAAFIGFVGLSIPSWQSAGVTPCVEVGWRLARAHWGQGFASEAARAALRHGFEVVGFEEILSFTVPANQRSQAVMRRIGMKRDPTRDFDHPRLPEGHRLRSHVVWAADRSWLACPENLT
jgi:RimJ/RimL family protein N-acetyltransferase